MTYAVINRLPIKADADWDGFCQKIDAFNTIADASSGDFRGLSLIRTGPQNAVMFVLFASRAEMERVSRDVAAPWFAENIRPYLSGQADRSTGEVVAGRLMTA